MGTLYVVATPLGNLRDITPRAVEALRGASLVACEDTRHTRVLLSHLGITPPRLISCHGFNERRQLETILEEVRAGRDAALVTDSGSPGVSDPGSLVVAAALNEGLRVSPIPGPSAVAAAVSVSGFSSTGFLFAGFLPARAGERRRALGALAEETRPLVFYEAPHRIAAAAAALREVLGDRQVTVLREATKMHEEVRRTSLAGLAAALESGRMRARGEFTLVVEGKTAREPRTASADLGGLRRRYETLLAGGVDRREALRLLARETGLPRREVYAAVSLSGEEDE